MPSDPVTWPTQQGAQHTAEASRTSARAPSATAARPRERRCKLLCHLEPISIEPMSTRVSLSVFSDLVSQAPLQGRSHLQPTLSCIGDYGFRFQRRKQACRGSVLCPHEPRALGTCHALPYAPFFQAQFPRSAFGGRALRLSTGAAPCPYLWINEGDTRRETQSIRSVKLRSIFKIWASF